MVLPLHRAVSNRGWVLLCQFLLGKRKGRDISRQTMEGARGAGLPLLGIECDVASPSPRVMSFRAGGEAACAAGDIWASVFGTSVPASMVFPGG